MLRCHEEIVVNRKRTSNVGRLLSTSVVQLDNYFVKTQMHWPSKLVRMPKGTSDIDTWKAVEYGQFLLYLGSVCMKKVLTTTSYRYFFTSLSGN